MKVNLKYFKRSGKWYSDGSYNTEYKPLHEIWDDIIAMKQNRRLPDLMEGHSDFIVSVDVPEHEHAHPHLII